MNSQTIQKELKLPFSPSNVILSEPTSKVDVDFMATIGLRGTTTYKKAAVKTAPRKVNEVIRALQTLESKYPQNRIVSLSTALRIAKKYKLALGQLSDYEGMIPLKNVQELKMYDLRVARADARSYANLTCLLTSKDYTYGSKTYFIIAPQTTFNKELANVKGCMITLPGVNVKRMSFSKAFDFSETFVDKDPVIFCPLQVPGMEQYFHVVTGWDIEAEDPEISNDVAVTATAN